VYSNQTINNSSFIKRFSHNKRFQNTIKLLSPKNDDKILDYGTGDGYILNQLYNKNIYCEIIGYEPFENKELLINYKNHKTIKIINSVKDISTKFNKISCFEVLEHLTEKNQEIELQQMSKLLEENGKIIISVPLEKGISSLLKNIIRILLKQQHSNTNYSTIIKSLFGIKFDRGSNKYISNHIGFYYNDLEMIFKKVNLKIEKRLFSPINLFSSILNSQVFYILEKDNKNEETNNLP